ncbi:MAG TPA: RimK/LysX family protein, partial [Bacteroidia bacterium]|nr:RimK/LysX family protein [Bacteroidia bacterium]
RIKAKIDTGARSSCLHTCGLELYTGDGGESRVRFSLHPLPKQPKIEVRCDLPSIGSRVVRDSGGHEELRPFVRLPVVLGPHTWEVEFSLTNRDNMKFRMLLGRTAMTGRFLVNPALSYRFGKSLRRSSRP